MAKKADVPKILKLSEINQYSIGSRKLEELTEFYKGNKIFKISFSYQICDSINNNTEIKYYNVYLYNHTAGILYCITDNFEPYIINFSDLNINYFQLIDYEKIKDFVIVNDI